MTRDKIREALVSAKARAWLAYVNGGEETKTQALADYVLAQGNVLAYDRTTPAASSDAGAQDTPQ